MADKKELITSKAGNYEVIRKLGEGYTGEVYLVDDLSRKIPLALKLLNPEAYKEGQLQAFKREFMLLSDLHHPHICKVYDFGFAEGKGRHFFTMELVQGTDLYTYTEKLSIEEIEELFIQITDALGFIHSAGLIHFDVKGGNILITTRAGRPLAKIVDFGLAAPSFEKPENIAGTVRYMSPEMVAKDTSIDYRADLYSLGIVLYRMLAGVYPNQGQTMKEVLNWHLRHTAIDAGPLKEKEAPEYLVEVIEKLTRRIPTERFSSAAVIIRFVELHSGKTYTKTQKRLVATLMEEGPLVARDQIMYEIRSVFNQLSKKGPLPEDEHQTLVLTGPAGSGKSRLIKEARYVSQLTELTTYIIRGEQEGQDMDLFKQALGLPHVKDQELPAAILAREPLCLMVDDLERCNRQVKEFITGFASSIYSSRFLGNPHQIYLIVTMTTDSPADPLPVPLHLDTDHEHLNPFTSEDITQYIRLSLGESNPSVKQVQDILRFSGGIPELVKTAIASLDSPTARLAGDAEQLFINRVKRLDLPSQKVLGYIALAERPLNGEQLITLSGLTIEAALPELIKEGFINYRREDESYQTATGAVSMAAQKALSAVDKKEMAARLLSHFEKEEPADIDSIVKYALIGAGPDKVADYLIRAGEAKEDRAELEEAYRYYGEATSHLSQTDPRLSTMHRKLARQLILNAAYPEAIQHLEEASKLSRVTIEDLTSKSWINRLQHRPTEALSFIQEAAGLTDQVGNNPQYLRLLNEEAQCYIQMGKTDRAIEIFERTQREAEDLAPDERKKVANNNLGLALAGKGRFDEAIRFYKEKHAYFSEDRHLAASILSQLGYVYQQAGLLSEGLETFKQSWELYSAIGDTHSAMAILGNIVGICQSKALFTDALDFVRESIQLASRAGSEKELAGNFLTLGTLYVNLGLEDVARRYLNESATIFQRLGDRHMDAWVQISFAYLYENLGRYKEALAHLDNVIKRGRELGCPDLILWGNYGSADMLLDIGKIKEAAAFLSEMTPWVGKDKAGETDIKIELLRSRLSIIREERPPDEVVGRLEELAERAEKLELRELASEAYHNLGDLYQKRGEELTSARYVAKAKEIIEDIAGSLSEEYRDSFLKQRFRQKVFEDSVRLADFISQLELEEEKAPPEAVAGRTGPSPPFKEGTVSIPEEGVAAGTSVFTGPYMEPAEFRLVGQSEATVKTREMIDQVKDSHVHVLISGEKGVGKELIAHMIHSQGIYKDRPFIKVDISAFSTEFLEHTLWGIEDKGIFELAGEGIIFLADIEKLSSSLQKRLAKVMEKKTFTRLKDKQKLPFNARVVASTDIEPPKLTKGLNKKLAKRLSEIVIFVPPLRERKEDIPLLIDHFIATIAQENKVSPYSIDPSALKVMMEYSWPGNALELEQALRSACVLAKNGKITEEMAKIYINKS